MCRSMTAVDIILYRLIVADEYRGYDGSINGGNDSVGDDDQCDDKGAGSRSGYSVIRINCSRQVPRL